jgi:hypothetical protein
MSVVEMSGNWSAHGGDADEFTASGDTNSELHAARRRVMAVVRGDERTCLPKSDRDDRQHRVIDSSENYACKQTEVATTATTRCQVAAGQASVQLPQAGNFPPTDM